MAEVYNNNQNLKGKDVAIQWTEEQVKEYKKCALDPVYFIKKYMKIVNLDTGLTNFDLYPFQEKMINTFYDNRFTICKIGRQSGKSITTIAFFLHYILFNEDVSVALLANKLATARALLGRLQTAYEHLPTWLQQGILSFNKSTIELENGSRIVAAATSSSAIRGDSFNVLFLDEFAFVENHLAEEFFNSVYPTISSGKNTKVIIVSTPKGMNHFYKLWKDAINGNNTYVPLEVHWSEIPGRDDKWKEETIRNTSREQFSQEFETEFLGSSNTLIEGSKLRVMPFMHPLYDKNSVKIYEKPKDDHVYFLCADVSHGKGVDYSTISVIDATNIPYRQVATYRNNEIPPMVFPTVIEKLAKNYNDAYVLIEVNDSGKQVAEIMHYELEYENVMSIASAAGKGQYINSGFAKSFEWGLRTTKQSKKVGCTSLKDLIEGDKLIVPDFDTLRELTVFVAKANSYEAEQGEHDDMVMTLVMFAWIASQEYFREMADQDIRHVLYEERMKNIEENLVPFGEIDDGLGEDYFVDRDGQLWQTVDQW